MTITHELKLKYIEEPELGSLWLTLEEYYNHFGAEAACRALLKGCIRIRAIFCTKGYTDPLPSTDLGTMLLLGRWSAPEDEFEKQLFNGETAAERHRQGTVGHKKLAFLSTSLHRSIVATPDTLQPDLKLRSSDDVVEDRIQELYSYSLRKLHIKYSKPPIIVTVTTTLLPV